MTIIKIFDIYPFHFTALWHQNNSAENRFKFPLVIESVIFRSNLQPSFNPIKKGTRPIRPNSSILNCGDTGFEPVTP